MGKEAAKEWILGATVQDRALGFEVVNDKGEHSFEPFSWAQTDFGRETTALGTKKSGKLRIQANDWRIHYDATDYISTILGPSLATAAAGCNRQMMIEFEQGRKTFLMPVMLLLKKLYHPDRILLKSAFEMNSVYSICFMDQDEDGKPKAVITKGLSLKALAAFTEATTSRLTWLLTHQATRDITHSIHKHALNGKLAASFKDFGTSFRYQGRVVGNKVYITVLSLTDIFCKTSPTDAWHGFEPADSGAIISTYRTVREKATPTVLIPVRESGETSLTDAEWEVASKTLSRGLHEERDKYSLRDKLNCYLEKVCTQRPWSEVGKTRAEGDAARTLVSGLRRRGKLDDLVKALAEMRTAPETANAA